jgi:hypothetical protein
MEKKNVMMLDLVIIIGGLLTFFLTRTTRYLWMSSIISVCYIAFGIFYIINGLNKSKLSFIIVLLLNIIGIPVSLFWLFLGIVAGGGFPALGYACLFVSISYLTLALNSLNYFVIKQLRREKNIKTVSK